MRRVLVVDDDPGLGELLSAFLARQGYGVEVRGDGEGLEAALGAARPMPDILLLDVMLPGRDGFRICEDLRRQGYSLPILMLTGRGDDLDRIRGLRLGADDYLPKPFNPHELLARIEAILRRVESPRPVEDAEVFRFDPDARTLRVETGVHQLTPTEARLMEVMVAEPGRTFTRDQLIGALDVAGALDIFDRAIDVQISRLRAKIESNPRKPRHLQTIRGLGYRFVW